MNESQERREELLRMSRQKWRKGSIPAVHTSGKEKHISIYVNEHETAQKLNEKKAEVHLVK